MSGATLGSRTATVMTAAALVFLAFPLVVVILFSFHSTSSLALPFEGFSTRWYRSIFDIPEFRDAVSTTLRLAVVVAAITGATGTAAAYGLSRMRGPGRAPISLLFFLPLTLPLLFIGLSMFQFFIRLGLELSFTTVVIAHVVVVFPFSVLITTAALDRLDPGYGEVGADLGASPTRIFFSIVLPQIWPVLAAGTALSFALSVDEFPVTYWVAGSVRTVPLFIYSRLGRTIDPSINAVSTLLIAVTVAMLAIAFLMVTRSERRRSGRAVTDSARETA